MVLTTRSFNVFIASLLVGVLLAGHSGHAFPKGGQVAAGSVTMSQPHAGTLQINQLTGKAIINWRSFSIDTREVVRFVQPSTSAVALNRVTGGDASVILGQLAANGRLFLINPNGIVFGPNARVEVGGLLATTLRIRDEDFLAGRYRFQGETGGLASVINQGTIAATPGGFIVLSAPGVVNQGTIVAYMGAVHLSSGRQLTLDFSGDGLVRFAVDGAIAEQPLGLGGAPLSSRVSNEGRIRADGGQVTLTARSAGDVLAGVVNNSGIIEARSLVNRGGVVALVGGEEALTAANGHGALRLTGEAQGLVTNTGAIDVAGREAGAAPGHVLLAGARVGQSGTIDARGAERARGGEVAITSSERSVLLDGSTIDVSGVGSSSAGRVTVWSDQETTVTTGATIRAPGGESGGNGGFVEVSGLGGLSFDGFVDTRAPAGHIGTLLLDPKFLRVQTAGGVPYSEGVNNLFANSPSGTTRITPASVNGSPTNVTLQANTDLTVVNPISMTTPGATLTLLAGRDVLINANVTTNNGAISLTANDPGALLANREAGAGAITMAAGTTLNAGNQDLTLRIGTLAGGNPGNITARNLTTSGGNIRCVDHRQRQRGRQHSELPADRAGPGAVQRRPPQSPFGFRYACRSNPARPGDEHRALGTGGSALRCPDGQGRCESRCAQCCAPLSERKLLQAEGRRPLARDFSVPAPERAMRRRMELPVQNSLAV